MGASAREYGGAAAPPTQPIGRASTRKRVPNRRFQDEVNALGTYLWLLAE